MDGTCRNHDSIRGKGDMRTALQKLISLVKESRSFSYEGARVWVGGQIPHTLSQKEKSVGAVRGGVNKAYMLEKSWWAG